MWNRVTVHQRSQVAACMTCSICQGLYEEATTINVCLHTFCKKCIEEKLSDEENNTCPDCDTYLGSNPKETLRFDLAVQSIRDKVFPRREEGEASETSQLRGPPPTPTPSGSECSNNKTGLDNVKMPKDKQGRLRGIQAAGSVTKELDLDSIKAKWEKHGLSSISITVTWARPGSSPKAVDAVPKGDQPVWFSLDPIEEEQDSSPPLPELSCRYLRIKKSAMPITYLQRYIAKKVEHIKADEVEIKLEGEVVDPSTLMCDLLNDWVSSGPPSKLIKTEKGASLPQVVMPLTYSRKRKIQAPVRSSSNNSTTN